MVATRKRAMREEVRLSREALKLVLPLNRQIGGWQLSAARLVTLAERMRAHGEHSPIYLEQASELERVIETHRERLAEDLRAMPQDVQQHGRIKDTLRALGTASAAADRARHLLDYH